MSKKNYSSSPNNFQNFSGDSQDDKCLEQFRLFLPSFLHVLMLTVLQMMLIKAFLSQTQLNSMLLLPSPSHTYSPFSCSLPKIRPHLKLNDLWLLLIFKSGSSSFTNRNIPHFHTLESKINFYCP